MKKEMAKLAPGLVKLPKCVLIVSLLLLLYGYNSTHTLLAAR